MFAKNSDLDLFANSAASLAAVFFWMDSRRLYTIWLICVLSESISPDASTVMKRVKSPSVAAAEICAKPRTCDVRFAAMVLTDILRAKAHQSRAASALSQEDVRDRLPGTLHIGYFCLYA